VLILAAGTTAGVVATGASAATGLQAPTQLKVNEIASPLAVPVSSPWLSWVTEDTRPGQSQSAYEVRVATTQGAATSGAAVWDSGKVAGTAPWTAYRGRALAIGTRYWWSVRTWDAQGHAGPWAAVAGFGTALGSTFAERPIWSRPAGGKTSGCPGRAAVPRHPGIHRNPRQRGQRPACGGADDPHRLAGDRA
jgi:hypothetical protein